MKYLERLKYLKQHIEEALTLIMKYLDDIINIASIESEIIQFKTKHTHNLWEEYLRCDNRLRFIFDSYALAFYRKFGKPSKICIVERTQQEQDNIYLNVKKLVNNVWVPDVEAIEDYKRRRWKSPHQAVLTAKCRALDFETKDMTEEQLKFTDDYLSDKQIVYTGERKTLLRHSVGQYGKHGHLQSDPDEYTSIRRNY